MITTCTDCGSLYEAGSEEQAYEPKRWCFLCRRRRSVPAPPATDADAHQEGADAPGALTSCRNTPSQAIHFDGRSGR
jgi:hypothetical protein